MFSDHFSLHFQVPKMSDFEYLNEIDTFGKYEYNNNIAYEFAIRNDKIVQFLEKFEQQFEKYELDHDNLTHLVDYINMDDYRFLQEAGFDLFAMTYWLFKKRANQIHELTNLTNDKLCKRFNDILSKKENHVLYEKVKSLLILFNPAFESGKILEGLSCKYIKLKRQNITEVRKAVNGRVVYLDEKDPIWNPTGWSTEIHPDDIEDDILPSIRYSFKRPFLSSLNYNATFNLPVNMEMDRTIFIEYMKKLKDAYDERNDFDTTKRTKLKVQRENYIKKSSYTAYEKKAIANATIMMYDELHKNKHKVFTVTDLFGDTYIHPKKPDKLGGLGVKRVKELLYVWDSLKAAQAGNKYLYDSYESYKKNHESYQETNLQKTTEERKKDEIFYQSQIIDENEVLKELYKNISGKEPNPKNKNHLTQQHKTLLDKLINNLEYKFLI